MKYSEYANSSECYIVIGKQELSLLDYQFNGKYLYFQTLIEICINFWFGKLWIPKVYHIHHVINIWNPLDQPQKGSIFCLTPSKWYPFGITDNGTCNLATKLWIISLHSATLSRNITRIVSMDSCFPCPCNFLSKYY